MRSLLPLFGPTSLGIGALGVLVIGTSSGGAMAKGTALQAKPAQPIPARMPTYATDVAQILNRRCVSCHRPGEVAPFSLVGYENAKKWSAMVTRVTQKRIMPPWKAVAGYGEFRDDNRLSDIELATLKAWHGAGAPRGDQKYEPAPPKFSSEWSLGKPDIVLSPSKEYRLDVEGVDVYRNFVLKTNFDKDTWVKAMDVRPGNKKIVHHVIAYLDSGDSAAKLERANKDGQPGYDGEGGGVGFLPSGSLGGWAPGVRAARTPDGTAFLVPKGTTIVMEVHYHKSGKPETDKTSMALYLAKEPIKKEMDLHWIFNFGVNIPAGEKNHKMRRVYTYKRDETIYAVMPHMHLVGRSMKSWLEFPDGTTRPLVNVDDWDFNWQLFYGFKNPIHVPKGTKQVVEAIYDNSPDNPRNPNFPPKRVTWGEQTTDEMFLLITAFTSDVQDPNRRRRIIE